jgi:hypothetical protein
MKKKGGRISLVLILAIIAVLIGVSVMYATTSGDSPESAGSKFMSALAKGDVDQLTDLSYVVNATPADIHQKWDFACHTAGPYYHFKWRANGAIIADQDTAALKIWYTKDANARGSYEDTFELPLIRVNGHWKVDVSSMDHSIYPAMPR